MRELLWDSMLNADFAAHYWDCLIRWYTSREQHLRLFAAIVSSGAAATLILSLGADWLWKILSVLSAGVSIYLTWLGNNRPVPRMYALKKACTLALGDFEILWASLESGAEEAPIWVRFEETRKKLADGTHEESEFPKDEKLRKKCQAEVLWKRKL